MDLNFHRWSRCVGLTIELHIRSWQCTFRRASASTSPTWWCHKTRSSHRWTGQDDQIFQQYHHDKCLPKAKIIEFIGLPVILPNIQLWHKTLLIHMPPLAIMSQFLVAVGHRNCGVDVTHVLQCVVTHRNAVCYTQKCSVLHTEMQRVAHRNAACYTQKCSVLHTEMRCVTHRSVVHTEMQCVTHRNTVRYTQKCSALHTEMQCVTHRNAVCYIQK